jgi:hypothetical protein
MGNGAKVKNGEKRRNVKRKSERKRSVLSPVSACQESNETHLHRKNGLLELCPTGENTASFQRSSLCSLPSMALNIHWTHVTIPQYLYKEPRILHMVSRGTKGQSRNNLEGTTKEGVFSLC